MRVRRFELRLLASAMLVSWALAAALVLLAYRPGGPYDLAVGLLALTPLAIAGIGLAWPPVARGDVAFPIIVWLGILALLCLIPSITGIVNQLVLLGSQPLLPSPESAYPWLVALLATSLFSGFGIARHLQGGAARRRQRLATGIAFAVVVTALAATAVAAVAVANDVAIRASGATGSRFGPTTGPDQPPTCDAPLAAGATARIAMHLGGTIDLRPIGTVELAGLRAGRDFRWIADVATSRKMGQFGSSARGDDGWTLVPGARWQSVGQAAVAAETVDLQALEVALSPGYRATAEDRGIEVLDGARARRCRIAVDGDVFQTAFPQTRWLTGDADLHRWRGQLDYWVFLDGQLGQVAGSANGEATGLSADGIQATIEVLLTATERGRAGVIYPPAP